MKTRRAVALLLGTIPFALVGCPDASPGRPAPAASAAQPAPCVAEGAFDAAAAGQRILALRAGFATCLAKTAEAGPTRRHEISVRVALEPNDTARDGRQRARTWSLDLRPSRETTRCMDELLRSLDDEPVLRPAGLGEVRCSFDVELAP